MPQVKHSKLIPLRVIYRHEEGYIVAYQNSFGFEEYLCRHKEISGLMRLVESKAWYAALVPKEEIYWTCD